MAIPDELERVANIAAQEMRADKESMLHLQADLDAANDLAVRLQTQVDRLAEEVEALKRPVPPPPPPPIEVAPNIELRLGARSLRPPLKGDRQGKETRYSGMLFEDVRAVLDVHDDGQVRAFVENRCASVAPPDGSVELSRLTLRVGGVDRHDRDIRLHPHARPTVVHNPLAPPPVDLAALISAGLIPNYDRTTAIPMAELDKLAAGTGPYPRWDGKGKPYDPVSEEFGLIRDSWSGGAGNQIINEAGHLMPPQVLYLLTRDPRAWASMRQLADSSGNYAIHYKIPDSSGGHFPRPDESGSLPFLQTADSVTIKTAAGMECPIPEVAHQHGLVYLAALLTGERYYREELEAWSSYNVLTRPKNDLRLKGIIWSGQVRASAWGIRSLLHCSLANKGHWVDALVANLNWMRDTFVSAGAKGYRPNGVCSVLPWRPAKLLDYVTAEPRPNYIATWNHHILASVMDECVRAGFAEAIPMRDHVIKVAEGLWRHSQSIYEYPWGNHAYPSDDWADVVRVTFAGRKALPTGFPSPPLTPDYVAWSRAPIVAGVNAGKAWAKEALPKLDQEAAKYKGGIPLVWRIQPDAVRT